MDSGFQDAAGSECPPGRAFPRSSWQLRVRTLSAKDATELRETESAVSDTKLEGFSKKCKQTMAQMLTQRVL